MMAEVYEDITFKATVLFIESYCDHISINDMARESHGFQET